MKEPIFLSNFGYLFVCFIASDLPPENRVLYYIIACNIPNIHIKRASCDITNLFCSEKHSRRQITIKIMMMIHSN